MRRSLYGICLALVAASLSFLAATSQGSSNAWAQASATTTTDSADIPEDTAENPIVCAYSVDHVVLGMTLVDLKRCWPEDGSKHVEYNWVELEKTGWVQVGAGDGRTLPGEHATFLDGQLISFSAGVTMDKAAYTKEIVGLTAAYGKPGANTPEWAVDCVFFEKLALSEQDLIVNLWSDEPNRVVFCVIYDSEMQATDYVLVQVDLLDQFFERMFQLLDASPSAAAEVDSD